MKKISESGIIAMIREMAGTAVGDDCAVLPRPAGRIVVTTDTLVSGVHFDPLLHPPSDLGRKCAAVNLSDIAAMGARPLAAFLSLALPEADAAFVRPFLRGLTAVLGEHGCALAGGDTVRAPEAVFTLTVVGCEDGAGVVGRAGAGVGETVMVSGPLGRAAAGLALLRRGLAGDFPELARAHLAPEPRVELGRFLAASGVVTAMMDVSDGLAIDLARLCRESGLAAEIDAAALPSTGEFRRACAALGFDPVETALAGGDDYELLFTVARGRDGALVRRARAAGFTLHVIGRTVAGEGVVLVSGDERREVGGLGYEHFQEGGR